jgi:2-oxoglutarate/2-oxoacid ferredoxin oxidoreductase subunit beta
MVRRTGLKYLNQSLLPHMWCSGCGNGIVLGALLRAFDELDYDPKKVVVVSGIGCWGKCDDYIATNALHTTHGRALTYATGVKAANPELHVVVLMGDGDGTTIGGNHLIHSARRNMDLTAILVNNFNYGMTGGQFSATTPTGSITSTSVAGNPERNFDICDLVAVAGANYVARETVVNSLRLQRRMQEALTMKGFSLIEAISPCTTLFGPKNKMKSPVSMVKWLQDKAVSPAKFDTLEDAKNKGYFKVGKLVERDDPDFTTRYEAMRTRIQSAGVK